jgi:methionine-rich copper-binding protein CopC
MSINIKPLTNEELLKVAPSIFSESPIDGVSDKYAFVPTHKVLETFRDAGYYPIMASESKVRDEDNQGYQKHIIQFRSLENLLRPKAKEEYQDIVLTNSHNRTSSFIVDLSIFRIICSNMLVIPSQSFVHHSIVHKGFNKQKVVSAINEVTSYIENIKEEVANFKTINLTLPEQRMLANAAIDMRFDTETHYIEADELLKVNYEEDHVPTLWSTYNRIQEAVIRGGVKMKNLATNKSYTSKAINGIDATLNLNKKLFSAVQQVASLKQPYQIAA